MFARNLNVGVFTQPALRLFGMRGRGDNKASQLTTKSERYRRTECRFNKHSAVVGSWDLLDHWTEYSKFSPCRFESIASPLRNVGVEVGECSTA
jgi:hypothetical protein